MDIMYEILYQTFFRFLWIGSIAGMLLGVCMLFKPQLLVQLNQYLSGWISLKKLDAVLNQPHWMERFFYRHHKLFGLAVLIGSVFTLYTFSIGYDMRAVSAAYIPDDYRWLSDALVNMLLLASVIAALSGAVILARPSVLRSLELSVNRWVHTGPLLNPLNDMHYSAEKMLLSHHRLAGAAITAGSLYTLVLLSYFLFLWTGKL